MDNYKLSNIIKKDLKKRFEEKEIQKRKMNLKYIKSLLEKYPTKEFSESWYDGKHEDFCCWQDVEGLRYGWIWCDKTIKDTDKKIKDMFIGCCKEFNKKCPNRNIFIAENDSVIWIVLPMRNANRKDVCMILNKSNKKMYHLFD